MTSRDDLDILLGINGTHPYGEWDILKELDRREKRKGRPVSAARKEANKRAHRHSEAAKAWNKQYHHDVVSPRRKAVRQWIREHPQETEEIRKRHEVRTV